jgi:MFS family permease
MTPPVPATARSTSSGFMRGVAQTAPVRLYSGVSSIRSGNLTGWSCRLITRLSRSSRCCQGAFAALLVPSALSLLTTTFTGPKDRGRAFGIYGAIGVPADRRRLRARLQSGHDRADAQGRA